MFLNRDIVTKTFFLAELSATDLFLHLLLAIVMFWSYRGLLYLLQKMDIIIIIIKL